MPKVTEPDEMSPKQFAEYVKTALDGDFVDSYTSTQVVVEVRYQLGRGPAVSNKNRVSIALVDTAATQYEPHRLTKICADEMVRSFGAKRRCERTPIMDRLYGKPC